MGRTEQRWRFFEMIWDLIVYIMNTPTNFTLLFIFSQCSASLTYYASDISDNRTEPQAQYRRTIPQQIEDEIDGNVKASDFHTIPTAPELDCLNAQSPERSDLHPPGAASPAWSL